MTADERLALIQPKIDRVKQHIVDLNIALGSFRDTNPYVIGTKQNPQTRQPIYYLASMNEVPPAIAAIAGDVLQNLRSALDHLAYQLFLVGGGKGPGTHIYFPIFDNATKYKAGRLGQVKGMAQAAIDAIDVIEPYKSGHTDKSDILWRLHTLNRIDKHRLLITVAARFGAIGIAAPKQFREFMGVDIPLVMLEPASRLEPLKVGDELFIDAPDAEVDKDYKFAIEIAINESQVVERKSLVESLQHMADLVDSLISSFRPLLA
jgi:hypothetical protein